MVTTPGRFAGAALALMGAALLLDPPLPAEPVESAPVRAACRLEPRVLDVGQRAGALVARIELFSADGLSFLDPSGLEPGVHVRSVNGAVLPAPGGPAEGIGERRAARRVEDRLDVRGLGQAPNGIPEAVVRFERASDGDPSTPEDGNADDIIAMLMDVPDGRQVEVCLAGRAAGFSFTCCDRLTVRNRGLRHLPSEPGRPGGGPPGRWRPAGRG